MAHPPSPGWSGAHSPSSGCCCSTSGGTGRSTPVASLPDLDGRAQAEYLANFRADSIVHDAELIRQELGVDRWSVLGQSFGGFCVMSYLSLAPTACARHSSPAASRRSPSPSIEIYAATYRRTLDRSRRYYERYPGDRARVRELCARLESDEIRLPGGDRLTARRFRQLGHLLGMSTGAEELHYIVELASESPAFATTLPRGGVRPQPALRGDPRGLLRRRRRDALVGTARPPRGLRVGAGALDRRARVSVDVRGLQRPRSAARGRGDPRRTGVAAPLRRGRCSRQTRFRPPRWSTHRTCTSSAPFSEETAERIAGMRLWLTNEYEHNGPARGRRADPRPADRSRRGRA